MNEIKNTTGTFLKFLTSFLVIAFIQISANSQTYTEQEQSCFNMVQGKVAYDKSGNKRWVEGNIRLLCQGTNRAARTVDCFKIKIINYNEWNRGIRECSPAALNKNKMPAPPLSSTPNAVLPIKPLLHPQAIIDIDVGLNGTYWMVRFTPTSGGYQIIQSKNGSTEIVDGGAVRIAVDGQGNAWGVNSTGKIYRRGGNSWFFMSGASARDIDISNNGTVWIADTDGNVRRWDGGSMWTVIGNNMNAKRIAVDSFDTPWIITENNSLLWRVSDKWRSFGNGTRAIAVATGGNDSVWIVNDRKQLAELSGSNFRGESISGYKEIAVGPDSEFFALTESGLIRRESGNNPLPSTTGINQYQECLNLSKKRLSYTTVPAALKRDEIAWQTENLPILCRETKDYLATVRCFEEKKYETGGKTHAILKCSAKPPLLEIGRTIKFKNEAGYVASLKVIYHVYQITNGIKIPVLRVLSTPSIPVGFSRQINLPAGVAKELPIIISIEGVGTLKKEVFSTSIGGSFTGDLCYKSWGTIFDAKGGKCN